MNNNSTLVTIIIPAYNTEPYIGRMLECVVNQTYKNLEILVVNDGSTDGTKDVIQRFAKRDDRIKLIDIPNGGVSNARNVALERMKGEKVFLWDSDDVVSPYTVETCLNVANDYNVNSVFYGYTDSSELVKKATESAVSSKLFRGGQIVKVLLPNYIGISYSDINRWIKEGGSLRKGKEHSACWHMMFDAATIQKNNIRFDRNLSLGEDTIFCNTYLLYESSIATIDNVFYALLQRKDGANLSHKSNIKVRVDDKLKLVDARDKLNSLSIKLQKGSIEEDYQGTNVLSCMEIAVRLRLDESLSKRQKKSIYQKFISNSLVRASIEGFESKISKRSLPFRILKIMNGKLLYRLIQLLPKKIVRKVNQ